MPKTKKIGTPKLPKRRARGVIVPVRLSAADHKLFEEVAKASKHKTLSAWIHETLLTGAYRKTE